MGRPVKYHTPEARHEAMRASWRTYNENHREQRCEANREYVSRPYVKSHIAEIKKNEEDSTGRTSRRARCVYSGQIKIFPKENTK